MRDYLIEDFTSIINDCKISLNNLNDVIMYHISMLVSDTQLHALKDRKSKGDKFISNIYRTKIDH